MFGLFSADTAKQAGLNTIETPIFWSKHEPRSGKFDFTGDNDIRHFISLIGRAGMHCMVGLGPFVNSDSDLGGLPAWLAESTGGALRTQNHAFLEACSRYVAAVADQIKPLQASSSGASGPIVLVECESEWNCGHETLANSYIGELIRYIRESGINVPVVNSNNLWQSVEGQIDGWTGNEELLATGRQLSAVRPAQPRIVIDFAASNPVVWGEEPEVAWSAMTIQRRLAEALAGGVQYNIRPFCGGIHGGFSGGRAEGNPDRFFASELGGDAPIAPDGRHGATYNAIRRLNHFASRFSRVLANIDHSFHPIMIDPSAASGADRTTKSPVREELAVAHCKGSQGSVVFVFGEEGAARSGVRQTKLLLANGVSIPVALGQQAVSWCLIDVNVSPKAHVDYCNLNAFAAVGQVFVCYGPAGSKGVLSVNRSPLEVIVPASGKMPMTVDHEGLTIIIANEEQIDSVFIGEDAALIGVSGITPEGFPVLPAGVKTFTRAGADGVIRQVMVESRSHGSGSGETIALSNWTVSTCAEYQSGSGARFASISGPADMSVLGCPNGYGWYRLTLNAAASRKAKVLFPSASDRLHLFVDGKPVGLVGYGPGAGESASVPLSKGANTVVVLAENLGRYSAGAFLGEKKGIYGEAFEVAPLKFGAPKIVSADPVEILPLKSPLWGVTEGDTTSSSRVAWNINHRRKTPIIVGLREVATAGFLMLGGKTLAYVDGSGPGYVVISAEQIAKEGTHLHFVPISATVEESELRAVISAVTFHEGLEALCEGSDMAFAKWEPPAASSFVVAKSDKSVGPKWWKATFTPQESDLALYLDLSGSGKGQIYVNGKHLCRFFAAVNGKRIAGQSLYHIPHPLIRAKQPNELMIFEENGASPTKCRLFYR